MIEITDINILCFDICISVKKLSIGGEFNSATAKSQEVSLIFL